MADLSIVSSATEFFNNHPYVIIGGIIFYIGLFLFYIVYSSIKKDPGPNPFETSFIKPRKPLELDQKVRDSVIKQAFHVKKIPEQLDAIVIGSGAGGLVVANLLARTGKKVLVLEQHDQAGGCCHTFIDKGFEFDVGIHYIGGMSNSGPKTTDRFFMDELTEGQLDWADLDPEYDIVALGKPGEQKLYPHATGRENWRRKMKEMFPGEEKAIDDYLALLKAVDRTTLVSVVMKLYPKWLCSLIYKTGLLDMFSSYFKYARKTTLQTVNELTDNQALRAVLMYCFGDYGVLPNDSSFQIHAGLANHFRKGAQYPVGGASEIAFHMIPVIEKAGGKVLVRCPVSKILFDNEGKACGVTVAKSSGDIDIHAPLIISNAGVINTLKKMVPEEVAVKSPIYHMIGKKGGVKSGIGAMSLFVGLKGTTEELGLKPQNIWAFTDENIQESCDEYLKLSADEALEADIPLLFSSFPSAKDPTWEQRFPGKSTCAVITLTKWEWFQEWRDRRVMKRGEEYEFIKNTIGRKMWEQVCKTYPHLEDKVEFFEVGSPLSNAHYLGSPKGEIYGLDMNYDRLTDINIVINLRPETNIPGLVLTGQDVMSAGLMGAVYGGLLSGMHILNRNLYDDLCKLKKNSNETNSKKMD